MAFESLGNLTSFIVVQMFEYMYTEYNSYFLFRLGKRTGNVNSVLGLHIHNGDTQTDNHFFGGAVVSVFVLSLQLLPCKRIPIFANLLVYCNEHLPALYDCVGALNHRC